MEGFKMCSDDCLTVCINSVFDGFHYCRIFWCQRCTKLEMKKTQSTLYPILSYSVALFLFLSPRHLRAVEQDKNSTEKHISLSTVVLLPQNIFISIWLNRSITSDQNQPWTNLNWLGRPEKGVTDLHHHLIDMGMSLVLKVLDMNCTKKKFLLQNLTKTKVVMLVLSHP